MAKFKQDASHISRRLCAVRWVALADALLLIALVGASQLNNRELVSILGPIHGGNFLTLVVLVFTGVTDKLWGWWFLAATFLTGGPPGAFVGEFLISRQLAKTTA